MHEEHINKDTFNNNIERVLSIERINSEINNRICSPKKYGGKDNEKNFIVNFSHAKAINRDFLNFYVNRRGLLLNERKEKKAASININPNFKPVIDPMSEKYSNEYKKKIADDIVELGEKDKKNYADILMYKRQQYLNKNLRQLEENKKKEMDLCTFSPKINKNVDIKGYDVINRVEFLYRQKKAVNPNIKAREEMELKKSLQECTFKPNIERLDIKSGLNGLNSERTVSNDRDCIKMMERLKNGREVIYNIINNNI